MGMGRRTGIKKNPLSCKLRTQIPATLSDSFATPWTAACQAPPVSGISQGFHYVLLQGLFLTQGLNQCLLHWQEDSLPLSHQGKMLTPWKESYDQPR